MKKIALFLMLAMVMFTPVVFAQQSRMDMDPSHFPMRPEPKRFINDLAHTMQESEVFRLNHLCRITKDSFGYEIHIVTHTNESLFNGMYERKQYATNLSQYWKLGSSNTNNRLLFMYVACDATPNEKRFVTSFRTSDGSSGLFPDPIAKRMRGVFNDEVFKLGMNKAIENFIREINGKLVQNKPEVESQKITVAETKKIESQNSYNGIINFLGIALIIAFFTAVVYFIWGLWLWFRRRLTFWSMYGEKYAEYQNQKVIVTDLEKVCTAKLPTYLKDFYAEKIAAIVKNFDSYEQNYFFKSLNFYDSWKSDKALSLLAEYGDLANREIKGLQSLSSSIDIEIAGDLLTLEHTVTGLNQLSAKINDELSYFGKRFNVDTMTKKWEGLSSRAKSVFSELDSNLKTEISERGEILEEVILFYNTLITGAINEATAKKTASSYKRALGFHGTLCNLVADLNSFSTAPLVTNARGIASFKLNVLEKVLSSILKETSLEKLLALWQDCYQYYTIDSTEECITELKSVTSKEKSARTIILGASPRINTQCFSGYINNSDVSMNTRAKMNSTVSTFSKISNLTSESNGSWVSLVGDFIGASNSVSNLISQAQSDIREAEEERERQAEAARRRAIQEEEDRRDAASEQAAQDDDNDNDDGGGSDGGGD